MGRRGSRKKGGRCRERWSLVRRRLVFETWDLCENSVVPLGLGSPWLLDPPLKRWAKFERPFGAAISQVQAISYLRKRSDSVRSKKTVHTRICKWVSLELTHYRIS